MPKFIRKRRPSTASTPRVRAIARREPVPRSVAAPLRRRSVRRRGGPDEPKAPAGEARRSPRSTARSTTRTSTVVPPEQRAERTVEADVLGATVVPSGNESVKGIRFAVVVRRPLCWRTPRPLLLTRRSFSSMRKNCRSPATPASVSSHRSSCWTARPLTGQYESQATRALKPRNLLGLLRLRLELVADAVAGLDERVLRLEGSILSRSLRTKTSTVRSRWVWRRPQTFCRTSSRVTTRPRSSARA